MSPHAKEIFLQLHHATPQAAAAIPDWIPVAALITAAFGLIGLLATRAWERRDRRRTLYSEAYQAALAWEEVYYRVRRRDPDGAYELAASVHEIQEKINFFEGWIGSESPALGRAFCRLVLTVKAHTAEPIRRAWTELPAKPEDGFSVEALIVAEIEAAKQRFIADLRDHLSLFPPRRGALVHRYEDAQWAEIKRQIGNRDNN